ICFSLTRRLQNFRGRDHHAKIDNFVIITLQDDAHDVLADIVHVAFYCRHHDAALRFCASRFLRLHERHQVGDGFFHHPRALHHLRQKHLSGAEQIANHAHPGHKRTFDDIKWALAFLPRLLRVDIDVIDDSFDQRVLQAVFYTLLAHGVYSPKRKRNVAYTAAHACAWKIFFNPARRLDEIDRIVTMLLQTSCDSQDVWVENDIVRRETGALSQEFVSPRADVDLA